VACTYIGDGTWGEGAVYEALNMAALWRVPLVVVVEHNGIAQSTPTAAQMAGTVARRAAAFGIAHHRTESCDVNDIRNQLRPRFERVRASCEPLVVEFATHRLGPHSKGDDSRPPELVAQADRHDWYRCYSQAYPDQTARWDAEVGALVAQAVDEVLSRPPSEWSEQ
jgi:pyruvate dehydrogenase E1 component alpha subunit